MSTSIRLRLSLSLCPLRRNPLTETCQYNFRRRSHHHHHHHHHQPTLTTLQQAQIADSEAIRLPTLKELIGYPTTYDFTVTAPSVLSHLPRLDVDNDISRQTVEESEVVDSSDLSGLSSERVLAEETGNSWLRQASDSKARPRATKRENVPEEQASVTNAVQEEENKRERSSTAIYLKPTTMRGIPLASLTPSPVTHGFYVTKSDNDLPSTVWTESLTSIDGPTGEQSGTTSMADIPTTYEVSTVPHNDQHEPESSTVDYLNDIVNDEEDEEDARGTNFTTFSSPTISSEESAENSADYEESEEVIQAGDGVALKRGKSLRHFGRGATTLLNAPVASPTTPTRRAIALAVSRYNDLTTPLWTGRRIVGKKRVRTTVSPIKDAIKRTEGGFVHSTASVFGTASPAIPSMSIATTWKLGAIPTTSTVALERATSPETSNVYDQPTDSANRETENSTSRTATETTMTLTTESDFPVANMSPDDLVEYLVSKATSDSASVTTIVAGDTSVTVESPTKNDSSTTTSAGEEDSFAVTNYTMIPTITVDAAADETTAATNHLTATTPPANTRAMEPDSVIATVAITTDHVVTVRNGSADDHMAVLPETTVDTSGSELTTTVETAAAEAEVTPTVANHFTEEQTTAPIPETTTWTMTPTEIVTASATDADTTMTDAVIVTESIRVTIPAISDRPDAVTTPASASIVDFAIADNLSTDSENPLETSSQVSVINADLTTMRSISTTTATLSATESSTITFVAPTARNIDANVEAPAATEILESTHPTETSMFEPFPTLAVTMIAKSFASTDPETLFTQTDETPTTVTQISSTLFPVANTTTMALEESTILPSTPAISHESIATNTILETTEESAYETSSARTTNKEFTRSVLKTIPEEVTARPARSRTRGQTRFNQTDKTSTTVIQTSSTSFPVADTVIVAVEESTILPSTPAISHESIATNTILETTEESAYETSSARTTSKEPTKSVSKTIPEEATAGPARSRTRGQTRFSQTDKTSTTVTQTSSMLFPIANTATVALEVSTILPSTPATFHESIATNTILETTEESAYETSSARTTSKEPTKSVLKTIPEEATAGPARSRMRNQTRFTQTDKTSTTVTQTSSMLFPIANTATVALEVSTILPSTPATFHESIATNTILETTEKSTYKTSEEPTRPVLKTTSQEATARAAPNRTRGRTRSELAAIGHQFGRRTVARTVVHRRVIKRPTDEDIEPSTTKQPIRQYPRRRITVYRGRPRRPTYSHPSSVFEKNQRRRVVQKRLRGSFQMLNSTARSDENVVDVRDSSEERVTHNRVEDMGRRKKIVLKRVREREETSASPAEETMVLGESSNLTKDSELGAHPEDGKMGRRRKIIVKRIKSQAEEGNLKKEETGNDIDSSTGSPPDESQSDLRGDLIKAERTRRKMRVVLKRLKSMSEEGRTESDSSDENRTHTHLTNHRASNSFTEDGNAKRRARVVLKSVRPVSKESNATEKASKAGTDDETLQGGFSSGARAGKSLFGESTGRIMRVILKSVRAKSEREESAASEEANEDSESSDDDLQGNFSNNLYVSDDHPDVDETKTTKSEPGEEEVATRGEQLAEATSARVEEDTDRPSHEVSAALKPESLDFPP
ncbi:hypothetical protein EAI_15769 [Harpegnathos saltator]|uniref:Uncharacterized protein n=1 Tax=Harpegnathos saltator TaxID=610380 RepID=E2C8C6_HARSA|nr:hypothetical protein EAI_15769 [Harpegnathos saltator]